METHSLFFLKTLSEVIERTRETFPFLDESLPPSEILSMSDKFLKVIGSIDTTISVLKNVGRQLDFCYQQDISYYRDLQNNLLNRYNERKATGNQLNINAELYDGENFLKEFIWDAVKGIEIQTISKPEEYSVLKIVDRLKENGRTLDFINQFDKRLFDSLLNQLNIISSAVLSIRKLLANPKYMMAMSTDSTTPETINFVTTIGSSMRDILKILENLHSNTVQVFQLHILLSQNYAIFVKAIDAITSIALECYFDPMVDFVIQ